MDDNSVRKKKEGIEVKKGRKRESDLSGIRERGGR